MARLANVTGSAGRPPRYAGRSSLRLLEQLESRRLLAITLEVMPDLAAFLVNDGAEPIAIDGYYLESRTKTLSAAEWRSIADWTQADASAVSAALGPGAVAFGEVAATDAALAEVNLSAAGLWSPGTRIGIGRPFTGLQSDVPANVRFSYRKAEFGAEQERGAVTLVPAASAPSATFATVPADLLTNPLDSLQIEFTEPVSGVGLEDLVIIHEGKAAPLPELATLTTVDHKSYRLSGFAAVQPAGGEYSLELRAIGSQIVDAEGFAFVASVTADWQVRDPLSVAIETIESPQHAPVNSLQITFSEAVTGFDLADLSLTLNGGSNLLTGQETLSTEDHKSWTLSGMAGIPGAGDGLYRLALEADGSGIEDTYARLLRADGAGQWLLETIDLTASIVHVQPDAFLGHRDSVRIVFSEPVTGFALGDLSLRWTDGRSWSTLVGAGATLTKIDGATYEIGALPTPRGDLEITLTLKPNSVADVNGNPLREGTSKTWREDLQGPGAWFVPPAGWMSPDVMSSITVVFTEPVTGLEQSDFVLTEGFSGPNLLTRAQTITQIDAVTWRLNNLGAATKADGFYVVDVLNPRGAIKDLAGNPLAGTSHHYWSVIHAPFAASIINLQSLPRESNIDSLDLRFSREVRGLAPEALRLTRDGGPNLLTGFETLEYVDLTTFHLSGLSPLTQLPGRYTLTVVAWNSGISDGYGHPLLADASKQWSVAPQVVIDPEGLATNAQPLEGIAIEFSAKVQGFDLADLSFTRDGGPNLLTAGQTLTTIDGQKWRLGNLIALTAQDGVYELKLKAAGSGIATQSNVLIATDASKTFAIAHTGPGVTDIKLVRSAEWAAPDGLTVQFSDAIYGASLAGLSLTRDNGPNLLDAGTKLATVGNVLTLSGLGAKLAAPGVYRFSFSPYNSDLHDVRFNPIAGNAALTWQTEPTLVMRVAADGSAELVNRLAQPLSVDGYLLESSGGRLNVGNWRSIADWVAADNATVLAELGAGALGFSEVNSASTSIGELTLGAGGQWKSGQAVGLGRPFDGAVTDILAQSAFTYHIAGISRAFFGSFELDVSPGGPTAQIGAVTPDPTTAAVDSLRIDFSSAVVGFELGDLRFTADGVVVPWSAAQTLTSSDGVHWTLNGLSALTDRNADYEVSLFASGSQVFDGQGRPLVVDVAETWRADTQSPTATWGGVGAAQSAPVDSLLLTFSEPVQGLNLADVEISFNGGRLLLSPSQSLESNDNRNWVLAGLAPLTTAEGKYSVRVRQDSGVQDLLGNPLGGDPSLQFVIDRTAPTVEIVDVSPDPGPRVKQIEVRFNEPVTGLKGKDFVVMADNGKTATLNSAKLESTDGQTWFLSNLVDLPFRFTGKLTLQLSPGGGQIRDLAGNALVEGATEQWRQEVTPPTASSEFPPDWTGDRPVPWIGITFSEPVLGFDLDDIILIHGIVELPMTADQSLVQMSPTHWQLDNLADLNMPEGGYRLALRSHHGITDLIGNDLSEFYGQSWGRYSTEPRATILPVAPSTPGGPIEDFDIKIFDMDHWTVDLSGVSLTRNGGPNLLDSNSSIWQSNWDPTFRLHLPAGLTSQPGTYRLTFGGGDTKIRSFFGMPMVIPEVEQWTVGFAAQIEAVGRDPRNQTVDRLTIEFSEPVQGFDLTDVALLRDGGQNLLTGAQTLTTTDGRVWVLNNLGPLTATSGSYALVVAAENSGIETKTGVPLSVGIQEKWTADFAAPVGTIQEVSPSVRTSLPRVTFELSEPLPGFSLANIALRRNGTLVDLFGSSTRLKSADQIHWTLDFGRTYLPDGEYELALVDYGLADAAGNKLFRTTRTWTILTDPSRYDADFDQSGSVDLADFAVFKSHFATGKTAAEGDADGDGDVDLFDFGILKTQFGAAPQAAAAADRVFARLGL